MALQTTANTFQDAVTGAFKALFNAAEKEVSQRLEYTQIGYADDTIAIPNEQRNSISGPSAGVLTLEGVEYGDVEKFRAFPITVNPRKFSLKYTFTEEVLHWLQMATSTNMVTNEVNNAASDLVTSLYQNVDSNAADVLYLGFGTTSSVNSSGTVGNSEALFSSHALRKPGASNVRNTFASGDIQRPLDSAALRTAIDILNRYRGHADVQLTPTKDIHLVVPVELGATAYRIVKSDYGPDTANLGISPVSENALAGRGMKIGIAVNSWIPPAYSTYWFLTAKDRAAKSLKMGWAWRPRVQEDDTRRSAGTLQFVGSVYFRPISQGWDWAFGSQGNSAAI